MATRILPLPRPAWSDGNGAPLEGGMVFTYEPGTTTPKPTYQDIGQAVAHANPIVLNARGEPNAAIYYDGEYKIVVKDSAGATIYTQDNYGDAEALTLPSGPNLLANGDFEIDLDGDGAPDAWVLTISSGNTIAIDTTNVKSGANALKFTTTNGTKAGTATSDPVPFVAAEVLYLRGWTVSNTTSLTNKVIVDWYSDVTTLISSDTLYDDAGTSVTSLTEIADNATAPAATKYFKIRIEGADGGGANLGAAWFDAFRVERQTEAAITLTGDPTIGGALRVGGALRLESTAPSLLFDETDGATDEKVWRVKASGNQLIIEALNDAETGSTAAFTLSRTGQTPDGLALNFGSNEVTIGGNVVWNAGNAATAPGLDASTASTGYVDLPGGLILQWGSGLVTGDNTAALSFAKTFPTACLQGVACSAADDRVDAGDQSTPVLSFTTTTITILNNNNNDVTVRWFAIGH